MGTGKSASRRVLMVVMDGMGVRESDYGNAVALAFTPVLDTLKKTALYRTLKAHGTAVGLPSDDDIGNSEVGHNAIGAGRIFDQGAKLVSKSIESGEMFAGTTWQSMVKSVKDHNATLHFIGLLSDGNVHSHQNHLHRMIERAKQDGVKHVRIHVLLDGRDVGEKSAEIYVDRLEKLMTTLRSPDFDIKVASGGGRMKVTMDRYEADWGMVQRGWEAHVEGEAPFKFGSLSEAVRHFRDEPGLTDQYFPPFVITEGGMPVGKINDGDGVVFYNFRGDRAIEITRAFTEEGLDKFPRRRVPKVFFAGMMEYDGDLHIPPNYLVSPPTIRDTLGEYLVKNDVRQFACSETQKFGHVTYFFNGNRSGRLDDVLEEYVEIPSDHVPFHCKPWMKAYEITEATIERLRGKTFDFGRINYANGDMVGHTGDLEAAVVSVSALDLMIGRLVKACRESDTMLLVTADHGNAEEMFDVKGEGPKDWRSKPMSEWPKPKTAHTLNPVPFYLYDPRGYDHLELTDVDGGLGNLAATVIELLGLPPKDNYLPSLVKRKS